ncbi:MAG: cation:proton antiporter [Butyricicoccus sp.]
MSYDFLLTIAIIMLFTKVFGLTSERVHMPQVVGALIAGVLVGPSCLGWVGETDFLVKAAEIGVIILMFNAGMDTDLDELKPPVCVLLCADRCYRAADRGVHAIGVRHDPTDPMNMLRLLHRCRSDRYWFHLSRPA